MVYDGLLRVNLQPMNDAPEQNQPIVSHFNLATAAKENQF